MQGPYDGRLDLNRSDHGGDHLDPAPPRPQIRIHQQDPAPNPNRGATATKRLGLWDAGGLPGVERAWSQTLRVERWRLHERLAQHFLICPGCGGKKVKLFLPLCTNEELRDAELAEGWIRMLEARYAAARCSVPRDPAAHRAALIERYGLFFRTGRRLLCRDCLDLRYGSCWSNRKGVGRRSGLPRHGKTNAGSGEA